MRICSEKWCRKYKDISCSFFPENRIVYETVWENMVKATQTVAYK